MADSNSTPTQPTKLKGDNIHVELTYDHLDVAAIISEVKSPKAGAIVLFAGNKLNARYSSHQT